MNTPEYEYWQLPIGMNEVQGTRNGLFYKGQAVNIEEIRIQSRLQYQKELVEKISGEAYYEDRRRHVVLLSDVLEILKD